MNINLSVKGLCSTSQIGVSNKSVINNQVFCFTDKKHTPHIRYPFSTDFTPHSFLYHTDFHL